MKRVCLLFAMSFLGIVHVHAQTPVLDVDTPGRHPIQITVAQTVTGTYNEMNVYTVPAGVRFVLEYAGGMCSSLSELRGVQVVTSSVNSINYRFPINTTFNAPPNDATETFFATPVRAYVDAGQTVTINFFGYGASQMLACNVSITGYLILP